VEEQVEQKARQGEKKNRCRKGGRKGRCRKEKKGGKRLPMFQRDLLLLLSR
jgi:hypothetical protein